MWYNQKELSMGITTFKSSIARNVCIVKIEILCHNLQLWAQTAQTAHIQRIIKKKQALYLYNIQSENPVLKKGMLYPCPI